MAAGGWKPNAGAKPTREAEDAPPIARVYVRLRSGAEPTESWPVDTGKRETTRWSLIGHASDIVEWREA